VEGLFDEPLHPYTRGLLRSIPVLGQRSQAVDHTARLASIGGSVPSLSALPRGCAFRPRCSERMERCLEPPELIAAGATHWARCWLHADAQGTEAEAPEE
jgi:oligopeptide/dipeptide ABC transporter ATP-binding protein